MAKKKETEPAAPAVLTDEERLAKCGRIRFTTYLSSCGRMPGIDSHPLGLRPSDQRLIDLLYDLCAVDNAVFRTISAGRDMPEIENALRRALSVALTKAGFEAESAPNWPRLLLHRDGWRLWGSTAADWTLEYIEEEKHEEHEADGPF